MIVLEWFRENPAMLIGVLIFGTLILVAFLDIISGGKILDDPKD